MTLNYQILGDDMQALILSLTPGQEVRAEAGAMMFMTDSIKMETTLGGQKEGGLMGGLMAGAKRLISGESLFTTTFEAQDGPGQVGFAPPYPGKLIDVDIEKSGTLLCQRDSFLCAETGVDVSIAFTKKLGAGFFGGEGFILQKLQGQGHAFIHSGGYIVEKDLQAGETLRVDTGCLVAFQESVDYDIQMAKGVKTMLFGGEGLFHALLRGPGKVYIQTLPFSRMADRIMMASSYAGGGSSEQSRGVAGIGGGLLGSVLSGE